MKKNLNNLLLVYILLLAGCSETKKGDTMKKSNNLNTSETKSDKESNPNIIKEDYAIVSTSFGNMTVKFFEGAAPKHVESFKTHAESGYYNGTIFHLSLIHI